jgi:hypothetical protein
MALSRRKLPLVVLPTLYLLLVVLTMVLSATLPGGAYYRMLGVNPLAAMIGMVSEGGVFYGALFLFGTAWWFFIGAIGWSSRSGTVSAPLPPLVRYFPSFPRS